MQIVGRFKWKIKEPDIKPPFYRFVKISLECIIKGVTTHRFYRYNLYLLARVFTYFSPFFPRFLSLLFFYFSFITSQNEPRKTLYWSKSWASSGCSVVIRKSLRNIKEKRRWRIFFPLPAPTTTSPQQIRRLIKWNETFRRWLTEIRVSILYHIGVVRLFKFRDWMRAWNRALI